MKNKILTHFSTKLNDIFIKLWEYVISFQKQYQKTLCNETGTVSKNIYGNFKPFLSRFLDNLCLLVILFQF